jgi:hypothetical protein
VGISQTCHEPRYLPRANQVCSASETRRDKLAANYLAFIQCPLHLCRLTAPECSLRTKCGDEWVPCERIVFPWGPVRPMHERALLAFGLLAAWCSTNRSVTDQPDEPNAPISAAPRVPEFKRVRRYLRTIQQREADRQHGVLIGTDQGVGCMHQVRSGTMAVNCSASFSPH